jgi:hypothetical protein
MTNRLLAVILACVVVTALVIGAVACGSGTAATTTTAQPATTTTAMATSTTTSQAAPATTSSSGPTASSTATSFQLSPAMRQYGTELSDFGMALASLPEGSPLGITDVSKLTSAEIQAAAAYATAVHTVLDKLKAIQPPAEIAASHQKLVYAINGFVAATDKGVQALQNRDQAALSGAQSDAVTYYTQMGTSIEELRPYLSGS